MKVSRQQVNVAAALIIGADFAMMLTALTLALPPSSYAWPVLAPHVAAALVMVAFGPYLLAVSSCGILGAFLSNPNHVRILLSHRPERVSTYEQFGFDLILTGHAHGGQWLMPFVGRGGYSPDQHFFPKYVDGRYALANGSEMIVSRGLARESTPLPRLFNPPEILMVELVRLQGK